ncbi:MAG: iron-containing alcohol dehydrogenase [Desulfobacteraceae bacterium]|nr:iron-containing alcohol dehydrogenase [Desulfobacteraceae bacterium]
MKFEFATATRIIFGHRSIKEVGPIAADMGKRVFVVTGRAPGRAGQLVEELKTRGLRTVAFSVPGEPTTATVLEGVEQARKAKSDLVIGMGGGSVLDTGKAIAALLTNSGNLLDYLEIVGSGKQILEAPAPYIAIPTTAGTGAEVTRNAVIGSPEHGVKVSMRSPLMLPRLAVIDPLLTLSMPPPLTAFTGLDTLTQLMEAFVSNNANPLTDGICREGMGRAARSLSKAFRNGKDQDAREDMAMASLFGGLALANAGLGAVHGFAGPLGGMFPTPHGAICGLLLPHVMEANVHALKTRAPDSPALARYEEVAHILTGVPTAQAAGGVKWVQDLCAIFKIPPLSVYDLKEKDFPGVVEKVRRASSTKGNPIMLTDDELIQILEKAF